MYVCYAMNLSNLSALSLIVASCDPEGGVKRCSRSSLLELIDQTRDVLKGGVPDGEERLAAG